MMPSERGFSMIELMVGLVILAMLMALGAPSFNNWILNSQIRNAAEELQNGYLIALYRDWETMHRTIFRRSVIRCIGV